MSNTSEYIFTKSLESLHFPKLPFHNVIYVYITLQENITDIIYIEP